MIFNLVNFIDWLVWWMKVTQDSSSETSAYRFIQGIQIACFAYVNNRKGVYDRLLAISAVTAQAKSLQTALNDLFDPDKRRILVEGIRIAPVVFMGDDGEGYDVFMGDDGEGYDIFMFGDSESGNSRVLVTIPSDLLGQEELIKQIVEITVRAGSEVDTQIV